MKQLIVWMITTAFCSVGCMYSQSVTGNWQGLLIRDGQPVEKATIIYFEFKTSGDFIGKSREEVTGKDAFVVKKLKGKTEGKSVKIKQFAVEKKKDISGVKWCNFDVELNYIDTTGYLEGKFSSSECRGYAGKIICYRSTIPLSTEPTIKEIQSWRPIFVQDIKKGRKAPEIRLLELKNFHFQPIFFDVDQAEIRPEFKPFLIEMVKVVSGHSDLRIQVTGHTDADGSDIYNVDLSQRRAKVITDFFVAEGLVKDRILIDFKGESAPISDNTTPEGKQQNRRVDFVFI